MVKPKDNLKNQLFLGFEVNQGVGSFLGGYGHEIKFQNDKMHVLYLIKMF
jgi:hypothetical protein